MSTSTNLFERATREQFRFPSAKGELTVEHLWDLPLKSSRGLDLDTVARAVNQELKAATEESFVPTTANKGQSLQEAKLDVIKHIIGVKVQERDAAALKASKAEKRAKLMEILADKQDSALRDKSIEEIREELAALD